VQHSKSTCSQKTSRPASVSRASEWLGQPYAKWLAQLASRDLSGPVLHRRV
jgi:hypothetical protein